MIANYEIKPGKKKGGLSTVLWLVGECACQ